MTTALDLDGLMAAVSPGGPSCLTSVTELAPAGGQHTAIAPAKFAERGSDIGTYAYERRYLDGALQDSVVVDSKQSLASARLTPSVPSLASTARPTAQMPTDGRLNASR